MALIDNLSALKQRLVSRIPTKLGVIQYQPVILTTATGQVINFIGKVTEPSPSMLVNFMSLGVTINGDNRYLECIPLNITDDQLRYGRFTLQGGLEGETLNVTSRTVDKQALVHINRIRR